jgi:hypothetical protein
MKNQKDKTFKVTGTPFVSHVDQAARPEHTFDFNAIYGTGYHGFFHEVSRNGRAKIMGYSYNLKPYLKSYIVLQHGNWQEYLAPNKTLLRCALHGRIDRIIENK